MNEHNTQHNVIHTRQPRERAGVLDSRNDGRDELEEEDHVAAHTGSIVISPPDQKLQLSGNPHAELGSTITFVRPQRDDDVMRLYPLSQL